MRREVVVMAVRPRRWMSSIDLENIFLLVRVLVYFFIVCIRHMYKREREREPREEEGDHNDGPTPTDTHTSFTFYTHTNHEGG